MVRTVCGQCFDGPVRKIKRANACAISSQESSCFANAGVQVVFWYEKAVKRLPSPLEDETWKAHPCADVRLVIQVVSDDALLSICCLGQYCAFSVREFVSYAACFCAPSAHKTQRRTRPTCMHEARHFVNTCRKTRAHLDLALEVYSLREISQKGRF